MSAEILLFYIKANYQKKEMAKCLQLTENQEYSIIFLIP